MRDTGPVPGRQYLTLTIECTSHPKARFGVLHEVTIGNDRAVTTPHDLEAERIARSFGGWSSCLHFVERTVLAYREALAVMNAPEQHLRRGDFWESSPSAGCSSFSFDHYHRDLEAALRHEISPLHIAGQFGAERWPFDGVDEVARQQYTELLAAAGPVWANSGDPRIVEGATEGHLQLWSAGMVPAQTADLADMFPRDVLPLSVDFFRAAHLGPVDNEWLMQVVGAFPTSEFAEWAVQQEYRWDRIDINAVYQMQQLGLSASQATGVLDAEVPIDALAAIAALEGVGGTKAAWWLMMWARVGVVPTAGHYLLLEKNHSLNEIPSSRMLDSLCDSLRTLGADAPSRTEAAVMLALTPDASRINLAVRQGARTSTDPRFADLVNSRSAR